LYPVHTKAYMLQSRWKKGVILSIWQWCSILQWCIQEVHFRSLGVLASAGWWEVWRPSPEGRSRSLQWSETGMEDPQEDPLAVHCFCVCNKSALCTVGRSPWGKQIQGTWSSVCPVDLS